MDVIDKGTISATYILTIWGLAQEMQSFHLTDSVHCSDGCPWHKWSQAQHRCWPCGLVPRELGVAVLAQLRSLGEQTLSRGYGYIVAKLRSQHRLQCWARGLPGSCGLGSSSIRDRMGSRKARGDLRSFSLPFPSHPVPSVGKSWCLLRVDRLVYCKSQAEGKMEMVTSRGRAPTALDIG